jgi:transposase
VTSRRAYRGDLSDARWELIEPVLSEWRAARAEAGLGLTEPIHDLREIVNAVLYVNRTEIAREHLPHDFPPCKTVYDYYARWEADGTTEAIHDLLAGRVREQAGRSPEPTAAIIDPRVVKTSSSAPEASSGFDAGKRTKGWKQHIATDAFGLLLARVITAASVQDTNGGKDVVSLLAVHPPDGDRRVGGRRLQERVPEACRRPRHHLRGRHERAGPEGVHPAAAQMGGRAHLRLVRAAPAACPGLRDPPGTFRHDGLLGDDRHSLNNQSRVAGSRIVAAQATCANAQGRPRAGANKRQRGEARRPV